MKIELEDNSVSAVLYNYMRHEDILFEIKDGYIIFQNEQDYQKVLDFLPEEKKIINKIEEEIKKIPEYDKQVQKEAAQLLFNIKEEKKEIVKKKGRLF